MLKSHSIKFVLVVNFKMAIIVDILKSMTRTVVIIGCFEKENCPICLYVDFYEGYKFHAR